ncbi:pentatricopeptide repeat-containing protein At2g37320-like [Selaginella moellendorffii]|uniref:pentatricopeptide repeat-containing protein At2g37320-like n=1 Tax=Selaginella moellendorffii TaxID=88036 RepID=UPI000D1CB8AA|nr:pentatricopeptide repeat-containing protein At2g37320-like [Selaginella moellendorffii]|eukprot:XP_024532519.1 pentatricopeptide repeat-containing protein At2g37320-like [Selaginella moellendorffii]
MGKRDKFTWDLLLVACCKNGHFDEAHCDGHLDSAKRIKEAAGFLKALALGVGDEQRCDGDKIVMRHLILKEALRLFQEAAVDVAGKDCRASREIPHKLEELQRRLQMPVTGDTMSSRALAQLQHCCVLERHSHGINPPSWRAPNVYFNSMRLDYGVAARKQHYCCIVDMLGRAGYLHAAEELVQTMPFLPNSWDWTSMLSSSRGDRIWKNGARVTKRALLSSPSDGAVLVLLANSRS